MSVAERVRIAYHEAGHAVAAFELGGAVSGPVSIVPAKRWNGVAHVRGRYARRSDRYDPAAPTIVLQPASTRRALETEAIISLAGQEAEKFRPPETLTGYFPTEDDEARAVRAVAPLAGRDAKLLARGDDESLPPPKTDIAQAVEAADLLVADRAHALLTFLRAEADALLRTPRAQRRLHRLAEALLEHETIGAATVRQLLREA